LKEHCFLIKQTISMISFQGSVMMKAYRNLFPPFYMFYCTVILGHEQVKLRLLTMLNIEVHLVQA